jgi:hypothetical protein
MSNLVKVIQQLKSERDQAQKRIDRLDKALKALTGLRGGAVNYNRRASFGKRRTLSAAARKRIAAAQRAPLGKIESGQEGVIFGSATVRSFE